jgi:hypothetical protein
MGEDGSQGNENLAESSGCYWTGKSVDSFYGGLETFLFLFWKLDYFVSGFLTFSLILGADTFPLSLSKDS